MNTAIKLVTGFLSLFLVVASAHPTYPMGNRTAVVMGVDMPENYLRIRNGPGFSYAVIGGLGMGASLALTGARRGPWMQIAQPVTGWVYGAQIGPTVPAYVGPVVTGPVYVYPRGPAPYPRYRPYGRWRANYPPSPGIGIVIGDRGVGVRVGGVGVGVGPYGGVRVRVR
jgi:hypothetical protein